MDPSFCRHVCYHFGCNVSRSRPAAQMGLGDIERWECPNTTPLSVEWEIFSPLLHPYGFIVAARPRLSIRENTYFCPSDLPGGSRMRAVIRMARARGENRTRLKVNLLE
jgi:hypothetical protein